MSTKSPLLIVAMLAALVATPLLGACHTVAGAGKDISKTGKAIENSAVRHTP